MNLSLNISDYKYYFFGSKNSIDIDVLLEVPEIPSDKQYNQDFVKAFNKHNGLNWNIGLVVIRDGFVVDTESSKGSVDSTNNSLFTTYLFHIEKQKFPLPIKGMMDRNYLVAIYKCVRTILSALTRTQYRQDIKPILKYCHDFNLKIEALKKVDLSIIKTFNQPYQSDADCWKLLAFYSAQTYMLLAHNKSLHSKSEIDRHFLISNFFNRRNFTTGELEILQSILNHLIIEIEKSTFVSIGNYLIMNKKDVMDMMSEKPVTEIPEHIKPFLDL